MVLTRWGLVVLERSRCFSFIVTLVIGLPETGFAAVLVHVEDAEDDAIGGVAARLCA